MDGFLSLLLFAGLFYFMMRFGCGSHMVHGHGSGTNGDMGSNKATDPVCGMTVQPGEGYAKMHQGRQYRFCSRKCLEQFDADPQRLSQSKGVM